MSSLSSLRGWILLVLILNILFSVFFVNYRLKNTSPQAETERTETLYDKVLESREINVGYYNGEPYFIKDPNTGEVSGIFAEILEHVGDKLELNINWVGEANFPTMAEDLESGKFDIIGSGIWINGQRGKVSDFTIPVLYDVVGAYVRIDDDRFDNGLEVVNDPDIKISTIDGEMASVIADQDFPNADANTASLPESADFTQMLINVVNKKADITFLGLAAANEFMEDNPGVLKAVSMDKPIRTFPTAIMVKRNEYEFTRMLNLAIMDLINNGIVDKIITKHEEFPLSHYRTAKSFRNSLD